MRILVTGGCGYVGSVLVPKLLDDGHSVTVFDAQWFGNFLEPHKELRVMVGDIRESDIIPVAGHHVVIHLANIANDPAVDLNPELSWNVNVLATQLLAEKAAQCGVQQFLYASSGSVYGVQDAPNVTEELSLKPISVYNKTKMVAERVLISYADRMSVHNIRPATVCGYSPRMRLDISVNTLTWQALRHGKIRVFGGEQTRPNINISDMVDVYRHFLSNPNLPSGCYNAGFENRAIRQLADLLATRFGSEIVVEESNDPRSYRQNSDKLLSTGFRPNFGVADAIDQIARKIQTEELVEQDIHYNVRTMQKLKIS